MHRANAEYLYPPGGGARVVRAAQLELDVFEPRTARRPIAAAAYALWHAVWLETFSQLDGASHLHSDEFSRQDEVLTLSLEGRCIAVSGLRWIDRSTRIGQEDSYFRPWPPGALARLGSTVAISSNTVIAEDVRRMRVARDGADPQRLSELTIALALRRFAASTLPELAGVVRNVRKMDHVVAALGFQPIGRIVLHGEESDIVRLSRGALSTFAPEIEDIWARRVECDDPRPA